jgi:hypothetical protein
MNYEAKLPRANELMNVIWKTARGRASRTIFYTSSSSSHLTLFFSQSPEFCTQAPIYTSFHVCIEKKYAIHLQNQPTTTMVHQERIYEGDPTRHSVEPSRGRDDGRDVWCCWRGVHARDERWRKKKN